MGMMIVACPQPKIKKEVRQFVRLERYYHRFVPSYSAQLLTVPIKKGEPDISKDWSSASRHF